MPCVQLPLGGVVSLSPGAVRAFLRAEEGQPLSVSDPATWELRYYGLICRHMKASKTAREYFLPRVGSPMQLYSVFQLSETLT